MGCQHVSRITSDVTRVYLFDVWLKLSGSILPKSSKAQAQDIQIIAKKGKHGKTSGKAECLRVEAAMRLRSRL